MSSWVLILGGGGIVGALTGIAATFVRIGRLIELVDALKKDQAEDSGRLDQHLADHWQYPKVTQPRHGW